MNRVFARCLGGLAAVLLLAGAGAADPPRGFGRGGGYGAPRAAYGGGFRPGRPGPAAAFGYGAPPFAGPRAAYGGYAAPPAYPQAYPQRRPNSLGADWREQQEEARSGVRLGQMAPLGRVINGIGRRSAGRPLDAGIEYQGGRAVYRVRWITVNGRRVDYLVDAATGAILSEH